MFQAPLSVPSAAPSGRTRGVAKALPPAPSPAPFRRRCVVGDAPASRAIAGAVGAPLQAPLGRHCRRRWGAIAGAVGAPSPGAVGAPSPGAVRCHLRAPLGRVNGATAAPLSVIEAQLRQRR